MALFKKKKDTRQPSPGTNTVVVVRDRDGWECARCGNWNRGNPTHCGCGAHAGLAAI